MIPNLLPPQFDRLPSMTSAGTLKQLWTHTGTVRSEFRGPFFGLFFFFNNKKGRRKLPEGAIDPVWKQAFAKQLDPVLIHIIPDTSGFPGVGKHYRNDARC